MSTVNQQASIPSQLISLSSTEQFALALKNHKQRVTVNTTQAYCGPPKVIMILDSVKQWIKKEKETVNPPKKGKKGKTHNK